MDFDRHHDARVRTATFEWLARQVEIHGEVIPRPVLAQGLRIDGRRVPLLGPQGIFKPAIMHVPLSITTSPKGPYDDGIGPDNLLRYRYRGANPQHPDNVGLRFAMRHELPLVYCHGVVPGRYVVMWPAYVVHDFPDYLAFSVAVDDIAQADIFSCPGSGVKEVAEARRQYVTSLTRKSMGQPCDTPSKGYTANPLYCRQDWRSGRLLHSYQRDTSDFWRRRWDAEVKYCCNLLASPDRAAT